MYDLVPQAVLNSELTKEYVPYDSEAWRQAIAQAEREDEELILDAR